MRFKTCLLTLLVSNLISGCGSKAPSVWSNVRHGEAKPLDTNTPVLRWIDGNRLQAACII